MRVIDADELRDALRHLWDDDRLGRHALRGLADAGAPAHLSTLATGRALRDRLLSGIALVSAPDAPETTPAARWQAILRYRYIDRLTATDTAGKVGLSKSQYNRDEKAAVRRLASVLAEPGDAPVEEPLPPTPGAARPRRRETAPPRPRPTSTPLTLPPSCGMWGWMRGTARRWPCSPASGPLCRRPAGGATGPCASGAGEPATRGYIGGLALVAVHARNRDYATSSRPLGPFGAGALRGGPHRQRGHAHATGPRRRTSRRLFLLDRPVQDWIDSLIGEWRALRRAHRRAQLADLQQRVRRFCDSVSALIEDGCQVAFGLVADFRPVDLPLPEGFIWERTEIAFYGEDRFDVFDAGTEDAIGPVACFTRLMPRYETFFRRALESYEVAWRRATQDPAWRRPPWCAGSRPHSWRTAPVSPTRSSTSPPPSSSTSGTSPPATGASSGPKRPRSPGAWTRSAGGGPSRAPWSWAVAGAATWSCWSSWWRPGGR